MNASLAAFLFWTSAVVCAVAELAIVAATARASDRASAANRSGAARDIPQVDGAAPLPAPRRWLELLYAVVPAIVLVLLFIGTWRAMHPAPQPAGSSQTVAAPSVLPLVAASHIKR